MNENYTNIEVQNEIDALKDTHDSFYLLNLDAFGVNSSGDFSEKLEYFEKQLESIRQTKNYLAYVMLACPYIDLFLRIFLFSKAGQARYKTDYPTEDTQLSKLISGTKKYNFDESLKKKLWEFNSIRSTFIHRYFIDTISNEELINRIESIWGLHYEIFTYVVRTVGIPTEKYKFRSESLNDFLVCVKN